MPRSLTIAAVLFLICVCVACSNPKTTDEGSETIQKRQADSLLNDSDQKKSVVKVYAQAIADYLKAAEENNNTKYDTLFFGRHVDFPDIDLPATIKGTQIFVLSPEEIETNKAVYSKSAPYINLVGWVNDDRAEFIAVTFFPEFRHQYDYFINYRYTTELKEFQLEELAYETYANTQGKTPKHSIIYQKGK